MRAAERADEPRQPRQRAVDLVQILAVAVVDADVHLDRMSLDGVVREQRLPGDGDLHEGGGLAVLHLADRLGEDLVARGAFGAVLLQDCAALRLAAVGVLHDLAIHAVLQMRPVDADGVVGIDDEDRVQIVRLRAHAHVLPPHDQRHVGVRERHFDAVRGRKLVVLHLDAEVEVVEVAAEPDVRGEVLFAAVGAREPRGVLLTRQTHRLGAARRPVGLVAVDRDRLGHPLDLVFQLLDRHVDDGLLRLDGNRAVKPRGALPVDRGRYAKPRQQAG